VTHDEWNEMVQYISFMDREITDDYTMIIQLHLRLGRQVTATFMNASQS